MFLVVINGSPKKEGNVSYLLNLVRKEAEEQGAEVEMIHAHSVMNGQNDPFCAACANPCPGTCYKGTELEEAYRKLERAHAVVLGSPVYFGTVSGQLKAFWDKTRRLRTEKKLINKVGAAVTSGAARFGGQETALRALHDMLMVQGITVVADGHPEYDAGHHGACAQQPSSEDETAQKRARIVAARILEVARATSGLRDS